MAELATRTTPRAAASTVVPMADASGAIAARAAAGSSRMSPPITRSGSMYPSTRLASLTVGRPPPRA